MPDSSSAFRRGFQQLGATKIERVKRQETYKTEAALGLAMFFLVVPLNIISHLVYGYLRPHTPEQREKVVMIGLSFVSGTCVLLPIFRILHKTIDRW